MSAAVQAVVFDMGNVLVDWNPEHLYRKLIPDRAERKDFLDNIIKIPQWQGRLDGGEPFEIVAHELLLRYKDQPKMQDLIMAWHNRFGEMFNGPIEGTVDILAELRERGVPLFGLTNWATDSFARDSKQFAFMGWFKDIIVSGDEKVRKPDPAIYKILSRRAGYAFEAMAFVDDKEENLTPAKQLGMHTIHFVSPQALRSELKNLHLI